jgi:nucleoside recognition membrane protein YjiH
MSSILMVLAITGGITLAVAAFLLAILVLRNPHNPEWVNSEGFSQFTALLMTTGISAASAATVQAYYSLGMSVAVALCVTSGIVIVSGFVFTGCSVWENVYAVPKLVIRRLNPLVVVPLCRAIRPVHSDFCATLIVIPLRAACLAHVCQR